MTDRPKTMMLSPHEWRTLVASGAQNLYSFIGAMTQPVPGATELTWLHDTLDRMRLQVSAWSASGQPVAQTEKEQLNEAYRETNLAMRQAIGNGTGSVVPASPKKKRGWQKGRKRGPRKPRTDEAVQ